MENLSTILNYVLGGTSLVAIIKWLMYRRENKQLKENEVKVSSVDAQRQEMELVDLYKQKMLETIDLISVKQDKGNINQEKMIGMLDNLDTRVDSLEARVGNIEGCLNGRLKEYMETTAKIQKDGQNP